MSETAARQFTVLLYTDRVTGGGLSSVAHITGDILTRPIAAVQSKLEWNFSLTYRHDQGIVLADEQFLFYILMWL